MPEFKVSVGGDIAPITKTLQELKSDLKVLKLELEHATDPVSVAKLNAELRKTEDEIKRIKNIGPIIPQTAAAGIGSATQSLTNLGRVAQDLPFGFIGIANNLNPLLEGFQRLRAETGSGKAALQALGSSLLGAGGIGVALSVVTAAFSFASLGLQAWGVKNTEAKKKAEELKDAIRDTNAVMREGEAGVQGQIAQVQALANVLGDTSKSYDQRKRALQELKEVNKSYFGDLELEDSLTSKLTDTVNEYTKALINTAIQKEFVSEIANVAKQVVKADKEIEKAKLKLAEANNNVAKAQQRFKDAFTEEQTSAAAAEVAGFKKKQLETEKALSAAQLVSTGLMNDQLILTNDLNKAVEEGLKFKDLDTQHNKREEDALKKRLAVLERVKKSTEDVNALVNLQEAIFSLQVSIAVRDDKKRLDPREFDQLIKGFQAELNEAFLNQALALEAIPKIKVVPVVDKIDFNEVIKKSFTTKITPIEITDEVGIAFKPTVESIDVTDLKGRVDKAVGLQKINVTLHDVRVHLLGGKKTKLIEDTEAINKQLTEEINGSIANLQVDLAGTLGESLGEAFSNAITGQDIGEGLKNAAKQMLGILGSVMQQIGKYVIAAAIKIQLLKKALTQWAVKNPALAVLAGIGLVAAGAALKNATFDGPRFAKGGVVTGPTIGLVGEAGKEAIIPLNRLPEMIGGRGQTNVVVKGSLSIRGRELVALLEQETSRFNRLV